MRGAGWWRVAALLLTLPSIGTAAPATGASSKFQAVTFAVRNRVFHEFVDVRRVKANEDFPLGDSEFSARVVRYVPDFQMDLKSRKVFSLSDQPRNPAFQVIVRKGQTPQDTTWAFLKSPPHFGARSYFAFQVLRIDFLNRSPLVADTSATAPRGVPASTHAAKDSSKAR
jgi:hypothetical protein